MPQQSQRRVFAGIKDESRLFWLYVIDMVMPVVGRLLTIGILVFLGGAGTLTAIKVIKPLL